MDMPEWAAAFHGSVSLPAEFESKKQRNKKRSGGNELQGGMKHQLLPAYSALRQQ